MITRQSRKPVNIKEKRIGRENGSCDGSIYCSAYYTLLATNSRKSANASNPAPWCFATNGTPELQTGEPDDELPDGLSIVSWSYPVDRDNELVYYVSKSAIETLLDYIPKPNQLWKFLYVLNKIQQGYFQWKANESNGFYTPISSSHLHRIVNDYASVIRDLIKLGIIEKKPGRYYDGGNRSLKQHRNAYRLKPDYRGNTVRIVHAIPIKAAKANAYHNLLIKDAIGGNPNRQHIWDSMRRAEISEDAFQFIDGPLTINGDQRDCYRRSVEAVMNRELYFCTDGKTGRVFNNFSNLWSELRQFLTIDGESLCEIDIRNSQPLLASLLYPEDSEEKQRYLNVVLKGNFYRHLEANSGRVYPDYKKLKNLTFAPGILRQEQRWYPQAIAKGADQGVP